MREHKIGNFMREGILNMADLNFKEEYSFPDLLSANGRPLR